MVRPPNPEAARDFVRTPVAVVVDDQEWTARSLDSILGAAGYAVLKAYTGQQAADLIGRVQPDVLFVDLHLPDIEGMELYASLRDSGMIDAATPVMALAPGRIARDERLDALARGAWDVLGLPFDADELVLRLGALVRAKQAADAAREESLVDSATGLYNTRGVLEKLSELRSDASRSGRSLACIVVGPRDEEEADGGAIGLRVRGGGDEDTATRIWQATRRSDAKGSLGRTVFVVVAPDTDVDGARRLAERIVAGVADERGEPASSVELVAGLFAEGDLESSPVTPGDFLSRATEAFRRAQVDPERTRIFGHESRTN
ncbi:MAG: response regulator [Longimicrobiales bacterium]